MPRPRRVINRLALGPVVGHTDDGSSRIWIQVLDDPALYQLRVQGVGLFNFFSTEVNGLEFRTAIAIADGLRSDLRYQYSVLRRGRAIPGARGSFRTMPAPGSMANVLFCAISCSSAEADGAWPAFVKFVEEAKPHFVLMMGDQVYVDEDEPDVFEEHFDSDAATRRRALVEKYRLNWSRDFVKRVMANVPMYMMWDDHDIRDGWGSSPSDSPTLAQRFPRGQKIFDKSNAYFEDARDVYWHFQGCHNPLAFPGQELPNYIADPPLHGQRQAMPYAFRCGRLVVLMTDSRGERDVFRADFPILGQRQGQFIDELFDTLPADVDALAVMTPTPIASVDPDGQIEKLMGNRTDDVEAFKRGDEKALFHPHSTDKFEDFLFAAAGSHATRILGRPVNLGSFKVSAIDEARDQWSHKFSRPEQASLLRKAGRARLTNRPDGAARELIFLSGDIHAGCIFDISVSNPEYKAASLTSSGISAVEGRTLTVGVLVDEDFSVASGIRSTLRDVVIEFNFGVVQVMPTGTGAEIVPSLAHEGNSFAAGVDIADLL